MKIGQPRDYKQTWSNLQRYVDVFPHKNWMHFIRKKHCLYFPMEAWLRITQIILVYNVTDWPK